MHLVTIIGGGFSGAAAAYHLLTKAGANHGKVHITLIEPSHEIGRGIAYCGASSAHILNVPACKMGISSSHPAEFSDFLANKDFSYLPQDFVPRELYASYVTEKLQKALEAASDCRLTHIQDHADSLELTSNGGYAVHLRSSRKISAQSVILAFGNSPAGQQKQGSVRNILQLSPSSKEDLEYAKKLQHIIIIGTGLSAIDTVLALESLGYKGTYALISRRGLLPRPYGETSHPLPPDSASILERVRNAKSIRSALRIFREANNAGFYWENIIDSLRGDVPRIWNHFSLRERTRFLTHLRPYWEVHRHRAPAKSLNTLESLKKEGRLFLTKGRITSSKVTDDASTILTLEDSRTLTGDGIFDCRGLWSDIRRVASPLLNSLREQQLAIFDSLGLGIKASSSGQLLTSSGHLIPGLYTLGSTRRGDLFESTAVNEIRLQAEALAESILMPHDSEIRA